MNQNDQTTDKAPAVQDQATQQGQGIANVLADMEGQTLYELYVQNLATRLGVPIDRTDRTWPLGSSLLENERGETPVQWKSLSPLRKAFWQTLAMDFLRMAS